MMLTAEILVYVATEDWDCAMGSIDPTKCIIGASCGDFADNLKFEVFLLKL